MTILDARNLSRDFRLKRGFFKRPQTLQAVDGVSFSIAAGEIVGLVGESGCGKSTLAQMLLGLMKPSGGEVLLRGRPVAELDRLTRAREIQPIFQDPYSSLNPRKTIYQTLELPLKVLDKADRAERRRRILEIADLVGLAQRHLDRFPNQMSGGQRQRVAIGRALITRPSLVICDEPTSALDVSVQAQILNLLNDLQAELGLSYLFITHDLAVVEHMASRVLVMHKGRIVEEGETDRLFSAPRHLYTRELLDAAFPIPAAGRQAAAG